ncbi:MAG: CRTAC1 family protein [Pirellula sp.]
MNSSKKQPSKKEVQRRLAENPNRAPSSVGETEDDSVIGKMFWRSLGVFALLALIAGGIYAATRPAKERFVEKKTETALPQERKAATVEIPQIPFTDITAQAGIEFTHYDGKQGERLLPETMGGGSGFLDYDNDGDQDILLVNSCDWSWNKRDDSKPTPTMCLYQNDGKGNFKDATQEAGLAVTFYGMGPAFGDYNNDGWVDVFITAVGTNHLYRNDHGKFVEVTDTAGVGGVSSQWSTSAMWFDYDLDGKLDLMVGNYVAWNREIDLSLASTLVGMERSYGQPTNFDGVHMYLYHNQGDGKFKEVGKEAGLHVLNPATGVPEAKTLGIALLDANHDGWMDVCVANDTVKNYLFVNKKDGTFEDQGIVMGVALTRDGQATGAMGIDCGNFRNDDCCGIVIGNFANEQSSLYLSDGLKPSFTDVAPTTGFGPQTRIKLTFGTLFADMDLDGRLDILCSNGHLEPEIQKVFPTQQYQQPSQLFWNAGKKQPTQFYALDAEKTGADFQKPMVGRSVTVADIDGDGDLDVLLVANGGKARLLRNDQKLGNHWLRVQLRDKANTGALGAAIVLDFGSDEKMVRTISTTRSYLSQTERTATFGLGNREPKELTIRWPDGSEQKVPIDKLDREMLVEQGA